MRAARGWLAVLALAGCDVEDLVRFPALDGGFEDRGVDARAPDAAPPAACQTDEACQAPTPRCAPGGQCVACLQHRDCPSARPVCAASSCRPLAEGACLEALDCPVERAECLRPAAEEPGVCVACFGDADCAGAARCHTRGDCVGAGQGLSCVGDAECGPGRRCAAGACRFD